MFVLALLFAYLLSPLVNLLDRLLPGTRTSGPALALAYVIFIGAVGTAGGLIGSTIVSQASALASQVPAMLSSLQASLAPEHRAPGSSKNRR